MRKRSTTQRLLGLLIFGFTEISFAAPFVHPGGAEYARVSQNTFIAKGAGGKIGGKADVLNFTHRAVNGDFVITARIVSADWSGRDQIGLMVRESVAPDAKAATLTLGDIGNRQCRFGTRTEVAASMTRQAGNDYTWLPVWFKIQRVGDVFTGFQSVDGANWYKVGSSKVRLTNRCLAGLAIAAQRIEVLNITVFDHVAIKQRYRFFESGSLGRK